MNEMDITPDFETINDYVLPNIDIKNSSNLIKKFESFNVLPSTYLTPLISSLLKSGEIRTASDLCMKKDFFLV